MKPKLVEVEWLDARSIYEQLSVEEIATKCVLVKRVTVGYLWKKDRESIVLGSTYDPPDEFDKEGGTDFDVIPRTWMISMHDVVPIVEADTKKEET